MTVRGEVWHLHHGERVIAALHVVDLDFPWVRARLELAPGFEAVAPLLAEEARLSEVLDDDAETLAAWESVYERIRGETRLTYPDGRDVPEYLLHVEGNEARWRWSDEPFDEQ